METFTKYVGDYLHNNYFDTLNEPTKYLKSDSCVERELLSRGVFLGRAVVVLITKSMDLLVGIVATAFAILTLGMNNDINKRMFDSMHAATGILDEPMYQLLKVINPHVIDSRAASILVPRKDRNHTGFVASRFDGTVIKTFVELRSSENVIVQHVASRAYYCLITICFAVAKAVEGVIGLVASAFMLLTLGKIESLNNLAIRGLQGMVMTDLTFLVIQIINPWAEF